MKLKLIKKYFFLVNLFLLISLPLKSEDVKKISGSEHEFNIYTGMFDFSDHGKRSQIIGFQHQNENLIRESFFGTLSPVTGALITQDSATYIYTGVQAMYKVGNINITPSFTPGLYNQGDGKNLGHIVEFKSEVQLSFDLPKESQFGFSYNHISNASLGDKNPGANSYMFNLLKKF